MTRIEARDRNALVRALRALADPERARFLQTFFKTGPGQYGEHDVFLGITTPALRGLSRAWVSLPLADLAELLHSPLHEERITALYILVLQFDRAQLPERRRIYEFYMRHKDRVNNWDLVDASAAPIVGAHLFERSRRPLLTLVKSKRMWHRRIAIVATHYFLRRDDFGDTLHLASLLLDDDEDLIHKATGWMLREVGKRNQPALEGFLQEHAAHMPRTMLRYSIERFPEARRQRYLKAREKTR